MRRLIEIQRRRRTIRRTIGEVEHDPRSGVRAASRRIALALSSILVAKNGSIVMAERFSYTVTPSGRVNAKAEYRAEPLGCA